LKIRNDAVSASGYLRTTENTYKKGKANDRYHDFLNITIAFYFVTECSNIAVFVWLMAYHATTHSNFTWTRPL